MIPDDLSKLKEEIMKMNAELTKMETDYVNKFLKFEKMFKNKEINEQFTEGEKRDLGVFFYTFKPYRRRL